MCGKLASGRYGKGMGEIALIAEQVLIELNQKKTKGYQADSNHAQNVQRIKNDEEDYRKIKVGSFGKEIEKADVQTGENRHSTIEWKQKFHGRQAAIV